MANKEINQLTDGTTLQDTDVIPLDRVASPWSTFKITALAVYTYILGKLETAGRVVPTGGTAGQVLRADIDGVPVFETVGLVPDGSVVGYVLRQTGTGPYDHEFASVRELPDPAGAVEGDVLTIDGTGTPVYQAPAASGLTPQQVRSLSLRARR